MNLNEAATLLRLSRTQVKIAIEQGIELPKSKQLAHLKAHKLGNSYDIEESDLDEFIKEFDSEEPGRNPPTAVRRDLLTESKHGCAICHESSVVEFHHIIDFASIGHYDKKHMLVLCPTHHALCTIGRIDTKSQYKYKEDLHRNKDSNNSQFVYSMGPANFSWDDLRLIITALHGSVTNKKSQGESGFDFSEVDIYRKNELNRISKEYYETVIVVHQPYFGRIREFLNNPINSEIVELYYQVADEIRAKIAANRDENERFEYFINILADVAVKDLGDGRSKDRRTLNILMSFMYVNCDIGKKE